MDDLKTRLDRLTPEQRAVLDRKLRERRPVTDRIPRRGATRARLTLDQERIWLLNRFDPADPAYNVFFGTRLRGALDAGALERAVNAVIARHEALRTTFEADGPRPVMVIHPSLPVPLIHVDRTGAAEEDPAVAAAIQSAIRTPFDLERGPLLRITLLRLAEDLHLMIGAVHHLVWDRGASGIFAAEVARHYSAFVRGEPVRLPELPIQYADYAHWQAGWIEREVRPRHVPYWRERLAGASLMLDLRTDRPRPPVRTFHGARHRFRFDDDITGAVRDYARRCGVTVNVVLLAAWKLLLARMTGQPDVVVGSTSSTRARRETAPLIGYFVTVLPLRTTVRPGMTGRELTRAVHDTVTGALDHHDTPLGVLLDELDVPRDPSRNPLYQTSFVYVDFHYERPVEMAGLEQEPVPLDNRTTKDELTFGIHDDLASGGSFLGMIEYSTDLFTEETIKRIARRLGLLLRGIVTTPDVPVGDLCQLTEDERETVLSRWNDTATPVADVRVEDLVRAQADATPDAVAVRGVGGPVTYRQLVDRAGRLAGYLRARGVTDGDLVGVCLERSAEVVVAVLGVLMAGAAYLPLDPGYPPARLELMTSDAGPTVLIADQGTADRLAGCAATVVLVDRDADRIAAAAPPRPVTATHAPAQVIYTSGSTGRPKGVEVTHDNLVNLLTALRGELGLSSADRWAAVTPISFDLSGPELFAPLVSGGSMVMTSRAVAGDGKALAAALAEHEATIMQATPATWQLLVDAGWRDGGRMRAISGGEAMSPALAAALRHEPRRVWYGCGPTETTVWSTFDPVGSRAADDITIGRPLANTQVYVLDGRLNPVPIGVSGEAYIGGAGVTLGYRGRPAETAARFVANHLGGRPGERLYRSGDIVHWGPDGRLVFDRRDDGQIKLRGHRIELGEVEARIAEQPEVAAAVATVREDRPGDRRLVAYVRYHETPLSSAQLRDRLRVTLPGFLVPNMVVAVDTFPLSPSGKVDRTALPAPSDVAAATDLVAPRDLVELTVARIWERVLGVPKAGVTSNFFDLGGHSLLVLGLLAEIEQEFGVTLPMGAIFQGATVERFAQLLRDTPEGEPDVQLVPLRPGEGRPLFVAPLAGNNLMGYLPFAERVRPAGRAVYGLSAPGSVNGVARYATLADRAAAYVTAMRRVQPTGPYTVVGWSYGGITAHSIAHSLEQQGETARVVLVDSDPPQLIPEWARSRPSVVADIAEQMNDGRPDEQLPFTDLEAMSDEDQLRYLTRFAEACGVLPAGAGRGHVARLVEQRAADLQLAIGDRLAPVASPVILLRATELNPVVEARRADVLESWRAVSPALRVVHTPGNHETMMREPHVARLVEILGEVLDGD